MGVVVIGKCYRKKVRCRKLVSEPGDQRPGSIIVKIYREELKREVRGGKQRMEYTHKMKTKGGQSRNSPEVGCSGLDGTGSTGGQKLGEGRLL